MGTAPGPLTPPHPLSERNLEQKLETEQRNQTGGDDEPVERPQKQRRVEEIHACTEADAEKQAEVRGAFAGITADGILDKKAPWSGKAKSAQFWYFRDDSGGTQGPFYPGQMRDWLSAKS